MVVGSEAGSVFALNGVNGVALWQVTVEQEPHADKYAFLDSTAFVASPALFDVNHDGVRDVLIGSRNATLYAFDGRNGTVLWRYHTTTGIHSSVAVFNAADNPTILIAEAYSNVYVLDLHGKKRSVRELTYDGIQGLYSSPVQTPDGTIAIGSAWWDSLRHPIPSPHDRYWFFHPGSNITNSIGDYGRITATAIVADLLQRPGLEIAFVSERGKLVIASPSGEIVAAFDLPYGAEATPLVVDVDDNGTLELLIATQDGNLYCFETGSRAHPVWGQFRANNRNTGVADDTP